MQIKASDIVKCEAPENFNGSLILRCIDAVSGESKSSGNMMITHKWEVVGRFDKEANEVQDHVIHNGEKYVIASLEVAPFYTFFHSARGLTDAQRLWSILTGSDPALYSVDTENPDTSYFKGKVVSAVVQTETIQRTERLSDEDRKAGVKAKIITDDEGKPLPPFKQFKIMHFNRLFNGELPQF